MQIEKSNAGSYHLSRGKEDTIKKALQKKAEETFQRQKEVKKKVLQLQEAKEEKFEEKLKEEKMPKDLSELLTFLDEMISVIKK